MTDRTQTPQAAAGVPDHGQAFLLAGQYRVPYLSLSFRETERRELIGRKLQRLTMEYAGLTVAEQLAQADAFDARGETINQESADLWVAILQRRMGAEAPDKDTFLETVGPQDAEALMLWLEGREEGKGEPRPTGTTSSPD